jgi:exosortase
MNPVESHKLFALLITASVIIWWKVLIEIFLLAWSNDAYTHILLIAPISFTLILLEWKKESLPAVFNVRAGTLLLGLAVLIGLAGVLWDKSSSLGREVRFSVEAAATVTWWIASFTLCYGARALRRCLFPLFVLFWLVPMPPFLLNQVVRWLQEGTASTARVLFALSGVPVSQSDTILSVPGIAVEVAQECSSIRSSMLLVVTSMVMSYVLLRSFWGRALVMLVALPLSVLKNGLRVFTLAALAAYVDPAVLKSRLHHQGGILFFAAALGAVVGLIWLLAYLERRQTRPTGMRLSASGAQ